MPEANLKSIIVGMLCLSAPLQLACGNAPPSVVTDRAEYYVGDTLLYEAPRIPIALCRADERQDCEDIIAQLHAGETVIVQDPIYYEPFDWEHGRELEHPLYNYMLDADLDSLPLLVNRIQAIADADHQWMAEIFVLYEDALYPLEAFPPQDDQELDSDTSTDLLDGMQAQSINMVYPDNISDDMTADPLQIIYYGPLQIDAPILRGCLPDEHIQEAMFDTDLPVIE